MALTAEQLRDGTFRFHGRTVNITKTKNLALKPFGKQILNYGQTMRHLPTSEQASSLSQQIGKARFVRHDYLDKRIQMYQEEKKTLSVERYKKEYLPKLKEENTFLSASDKFALESALEQADSAYQNFFSGRGSFQKFVSKSKPNGNRYTTKQTNNNIALVENKEGLPCVKLPKIGLVRIVLPKGKTLAGLCQSGTVIRKATVTRQGNRYEASLGMETIIDEIHPVEEVPVSEILSADMGLKDFAVLGDSDEFLKIRNPRWIRLHEKRLRRFQNALSRKQYDPKTHTGSKNWYKAKAVASVGWYDFFQKVKYKLERGGGRFLQVSRWFPSNQTCSCCGYRNTDVKKLSIREWVCPECGSYHDRDGNTQQTILKEGIRLLEKAGVCVTPHNQHPQGSNQKHRQTART